MVTLLTRLGFGKIFDTNFGADLTIMEEAHEFLERVQKWRCSMISRWVLSNTVNIISLI